jgi:pimeloyl-ACP methyl ester carboxylesterase
MHLKSRVIMQPESSHLSCQHGAATHKLHVLKWGGESTQPPVFAVHALTRCAGDFTKLAEALSPRATFAPDMVGRGGSPWLLDSSLYAYTHYVNDCVQLLDKLQLKEVDWVGTSMGGLIGMMVAAMHPRRIRKLVLNDVGPYLPLLALQRIGAYLKMHPTFADVEQAERYCRTIYAPFGIKEEQDWRDITERTIRPAAKGGYTLHYDPRIAEPFNDVHQDVDLWPVYQMIGCPVLVLRGATSDVLRADDAKRMTEVGPRAKLVTFEGCGHAPGLVSAEQIQVVKDFLNN